MNIKRALFTASLCLRVASRNPPQQVFAPISTCAAARAFSQTPSPKMPASIPNDIYQYSLLSAFQGGLTSGGPPTAFFTHHGTHGIGSFGNGADDMIQIDSTAYTLTPDGKAHKAPRDATVPFVMVTTYQPTFSSSAPDGFRKAQLRSLFASGGEVIGGRNTPMPFRIRGAFKSVQLGGGLALDEVRGTVFGYMIPAWQEGISGAGAQCCFLSEDGKSGGRVLDFEAGQDVKVDWAKCGRFHLGFPQSEEYETMSLGR